jgi:hypothetical protein
MVGVACTLIAVVLVPPVPFANLAPALAMGALSIGLTRKDGVFVLAGYGLILVALGVIALGVEAFSWDTLSCDDDSEARRLSRAIRRDSFSDLRVAGSSGLEPCLGLRWDARFNALAEVKV